MIRNPGNDRHVITSTPIGNGLVIDRNGVTRNADGTLAPGVSLNPGGRRKCFEQVVNMAVANVEKAMEVTLGLMNNPVERGDLRFKIATYIMEWAAGKPVGIEEIAEGGAPSGEYAEMGKKICQEIIERHNKDKGVTIDG